MVDIVPVVCRQPPTLILIAPGSEASLIEAAAERLQSEGIVVRCVPIPSWDLFDAQPQSYRGEVLPTAATCSVLNALTYLPLPTSCCAILASG